MDGTPNKCQEHFFNLNLLKLKKKLNLPCDLWLVTPHNIVNYVH